MRTRVVFTCPSCNRRIQTSPRFAGQKSACPKCGYEVIVPDELLRASPSPRLASRQGNQRA